MRWHHVQVACPPGGEPEARRFYAGGLGLVEVDKPAALRSRGGAWFGTPGSEGGAGVELHVGVEGPFTPARKAHPALLLDSVAELDAVGGRLESLGYAVDATEPDTFPGHRRLHAADGHGNRVELLAAASGVPGKV